MARGLEMYLHVQVRRYHCFKFNNFMIYIHIVSLAGAKCPEFPEIENGFILDKSREYYYNDEARVQCYKGFKLIGNSILRCAENQQFNNAPKCEGTKPLHILLVNIITIKL